MYTCSAAFEPEVCIREFTCANFGFAALPDRGCHMQIGVIGLGRMGGNITRRFMENGHEAVVYDHDAKAVAALGHDGATGATGLDKLVSQLRAPRAIGV